MSNHDLILFATLLAIAGLDMIGFASIEMVDVTPPQKRGTVTCTEGREPSGLAVVESFARPR